MHVHALEHIFSLFSRTAWWILMKLSMDKVLMVPYKSCCFSARSAKGQIQGGAKVGGERYLALRNFFFRPDDHNGKPNRQKWPKSMWEEVLLSLVPFRSQIFDTFVTSFLDSHFGIFSCNFYRVLCSEVLNLHFLCAVYMYISYAVLIF